MEEKVLKALKENPGARLSVIAWMIQENKMKTLDVLHYLKRHEKVYSKSHHDVANMEFYDMWYAK